MRQSGAVLNESDQNTFELIESNLCNLYRAIINESQQPGNIRIHSDYSKYYFEYDKDGILVPIRVNSTKEIDTPGMLFLYVFIITNFYAAMLFYLKNRELATNTGNLRCTYYLNNMLLSKTDDQLNNTEFLKVFSRIFALVEIDINSILIACINREMKCDLHGDVSVQNNLTG